MSDRIEVQTIEMGGFRAVLIGYADNLNEWNDGLAYLRMVGTHNAVRAIWAALVGDSGKQKKKKATTQGVKIGRHDVRVGSVRYFTVSTVLSSGQLDVVILHPSCTIAGVSSPLIFIADAEAEGPPPGWFERLNATCKLPLLPGWAEALWEKGQKDTSATIEVAVNDSWNYQENRWNTKTETRTWQRKLVKRLRSQGSIQGYQVDVSEDAEPYWLAIIRDILAECDEPATNTPSKATRRITFVQYGDNGYQLWWKSDDGYQIIAPHGGHRDAGPYSLYDPDDMIVEVDDDHVLSSDTMRGLLQYAQKALGWELVINVEEGR